jgi:hypothetical protein
MLSFDNANILAPFVAGFALEKIAADNLVYGCSAYILESQEQGVPKEDIDARVQSELNTMGMTLLTPSIQPKREDIPSIKKQQKPQGKRQSSFSEDNVSHHPT